MKPEAKLSAEIAQFVRRFLPPSVYANMHPAGSAHPVTGRSLKIMGLVPGFCDWFLIHQGQFYGVELKSKVGTVSAVQMEQHELIRLAGGKIAVAQSLDQFIAALKDWRIPILDVPRVDPFDDTELPW